jgi:hypothetical protein
MAKKRNANRVTAEITLSHLLQLAQEHGCCLSHEQALAFLNQEGRANEMWKHMMYAGFDFILCALVGQYATPKHVQGCEPAAMDDPHMLLQ